MLSCLHVGNWYLVFVRLGNVYYNRHQVFRLMGQTNKTAWKTNALYILCQYKTKH